MAELNGEKIDIIPYSEKPEEFIAKALAPATVLDVQILSEEERTCTVKVPNNQLSLAIGNKGQNAKLAAKLTGYKIDIKPEFDVLTKHEPRCSTGRTAGSTAGRTAGRSRSRGSGGNSRNRSKCTGGEQR